MARTILFTFIVLIYACTGGEQKDTQAIEKAESALYGDDENFKFDETLARNAVDAYELFAKNNPENAETPDILFKAADLRRALKEYNLALDIYEKVEKEYPNYEKAPHSIFLQGFVYENELFQLEKAKERYEAFLKKYPNHELADDVVFSLNNLGKSPEEIIKQFEQKQQEANTVTDSVTS